jgi:DNA-binding transcriptional MerR regulator
MQGRYAVRVAELSQRSGVPVPTIKFYLREGLLPPGELTSRNQAQYDQRHLHRIRLIRAMTELAQVPLAGVREVLAALDSDGLSMHDRMGHVHRAITPGRRVSPDDTDRAAAAEQVGELLSRRGWTVSDDAPALATLVEAVAMMRSLGQEHLLGHLDEYAEQAERIADLEVAAVSSRPDPDRLAESVVIGTVVGESIVTALRLLAQEDASARRLGGG